MQEQVLALDSTRDRGRPRPTRQREPPARRQGRHSRLPRGAPLGARRRRVHRDLRRDHHARSRRRMAQRRDVSPDGPGQGSGRPLSLAGQGRAAPHRAVLEPRRGVRGRDVLGHRSRALHRRLSDVPQDRLRAGLRRRPDGAPGGAGEGRGDEPCLSGARRDRGRRHHPAGFSEARGTVRRVHWVLRPSRGPGVPRPREGRSPSRQPDPHSRAHGRLPGERELDTVLRRAVGADLERSRSARRPRYPRGLLASRRGGRLGHDGGLARAALRRPRGSGAGAGRPVSGRRVLREVDHRRGRGRRSLEHESSHLGDVHALQPRRGYRHPAQHLVDLARPDAEPSRRAALRLQGVDQRLHGAPLHQAVLEADEDPSVRVRECRGTLGSARLHRPAPAIVGAGRLNAGNSEPQPPATRMREVWGEAVRVPPSEKIPVVTRYAKRGVWGEAVRVPPSEKIPVVTRYAKRGVWGEAERVPPSENRTGPPNFMIVLAILIGLLAATTADAQLPKQVTLATNPPGTAYYAVASGLAKVVSSHAGYQMVVQPYTGTSTMLPLLNTGEVDFGLVNAVDLGLAYRGPSFKIGGRNPDPHSPHLRLVMRGSPLMVGLLVRKDSPIKVARDIKGKRMTGEYPAHLAVWYNMFGHLSSAGLTWSDVKVVPVPAVNDGVDALLQGRAEVTQHALNSAKG